MKPIVAMAVLIVVLFVAGLAVAVWVYATPIMYAQASTSSSTYSPYSCQSAWSGNVGGNAQVLEYCTEASAPSMAEWCLITEAHIYGYSGNYGVASSCWPGAAP